MLYANIENEIYVLKLPLQILADGTVQCVLHLCSQVIARSMLFCESRSCFKASNRL